MFKFNHFIQSTIFIVVFLFTSHLVAQTIQLPLDQGRFAGSTSIAETGKDSFVYSGIVLPPSIFGGGKVNNLTHVSLSKGVLWSFDFKYPKTSIPDKLTNYKDGFLWSGFVADINQNKSLMRLDKSGNVIWSKRYGGLNDLDTINSGKSQAIVLPDGNIGFGGGAGTFTTTTKANDLFLAKIDPNGNQIWARNYLFSDLPDTYTNFSNLINTSDGGFLICGSIYTIFDRSILLLKTDSEGLVKWTRTYSNEGFGAVNDERGVQVIQTPNNSYYLVANQTDFLENSGQIIAQINSNGSVSSAVIVRANQNLNYTLRANKVIYDAPNDALIIGAGVTQDSTPSLSIEQNLLYKVRLNGTFDWKYNYYDEILSGFGTANSDLVQTKNGGFAHLTTFSENFDNLYPILIVSDSKGETGCQKPINLSVDKNLKLTTQSLKIGEQNASPSIDYVVIKTPFVFTNKLPTIDLPNEIFVCKEDTSIVLNVANKDFETYKWNTGETTPSISVNKLGKYAVTVTDSKFCLTLSDTVSIVKSPNCDPKLQLFVPLAFTPNNDGTNDNFEPSGNDFTIQSFQIYGRWGELVFDGNDTNRAWDGKIKGSEAISDVYVYVLKITQNGKISIKKGDVTLIR